MQGKYNEIPHSNVKFFQCCYQQIIRSGVNATADNEFTLTSCKEFTGNISLTTEDEFILVKCSGFLWFISSEVYKNGHALIRTKKSVKKKFQENLHKDKINVFLMGIDSISRLNLIRAMPETYKHLNQTDDWFELRGYNKIGDNTLPNLLAIFTGKSEGDFRKKCDWSKVGGLENCKYIWNDFSDSSYVTAYAEDESSINTFNYHKPGFVKPPTDHYLRPFNLAIEENLEIRTVNKRRMCVGYQNYADYIYNYGFDYAEKYSNNSYFGVFWTNSFSHEDLSMISEMDARVKYYLEQLETRGILNSSIVIFFSDHGMRFGPIRNLFIGWLEERLPFFYIWLPPKFRQSNPDIVEALRINRDRLSSPYDVHVTLKHILKMSGGFEDELSAVSCPKCQSLFTELPLNRSCADAGIDQHWCTCVDFQVIDESSNIVQSAVQKIISEVNKHLAPYPKCAKLKLKKVHSARKSAYNSSTNYLISFNVSPSNAQLEATIRCDDDKNCEDYKIIGTVSRLNRYGDQSICVNDSELRKYCYCM